MASANDVAERWLYGRLAADATIAAAGVHMDPAPLGTPTPYVVLVPLSPGVDVSVVGGIRVKTDAVYLVKAVCEGKSYAALSDLVSRIDAQLQRQSGAGVLSCVRTGTFRLPDRRDGADYRQAGGMYRLEIQEA